MKVYGNLDLRNNGKLRLYEASGNGSNFVGLKSPANQASDVEFALPGSDLANGAMVSDGSGNLSLAKIVNANVDAAAAIAYSKLNLSASIVNADIASGAAIAFTKMEALTASRALVSDGSGVVSTSAVTATELGYVSGVTSSIQTQLGSKISSTEKGAANGVATLDAGGKVPVSQLPNSIMEYQGTWNASTNSPTLADGVGNTGDVYRVSVAGSQNLGSGSISFSVGDYAIYNGTVWEKADTTDAVSSVNGQTGAVSLTTTNISEGTNLYFTDERAQDAVGGALTNSSNIEFTYNDGANTISADISSALSSTISGKADKAGATFTGNIVMDNEKEVRFEEATANGDNYIGFKAPAALSADVTYTLPAAPAANGYLLASTTGGTLSWTAPSALAAYEAQWVTADGTSKVITHSLGSKKVMVEIYDETTDETILVDSVVRTDSNTVTLTSNQAPGTSWRVMIIKLI